MPDHITGIPECGDPGFLDVNLPGKYGTLIEKVILYGSVARGGDNQESDVDLLVICKEDRYKVRRKIMVDVFNYLLEYGVYISVKTVSKDDMAAINETGFMQTIGREGVTIG